MGIKFPSGKNIKNVDTKTLQPHGNGSLGKYDKTSLTVDFRDNYRIAQVDAVSKKTISSTVLPKGTVKKSIPIPRS